MNDHSKQTSALLLTAAIAGMIPTGAAIGGPVGDFGMTVEKILRAKSRKFFGVAKPLNDSAPASGPVGYRTAAQNASDQVMLAKKLKAEYLTREAANKTDMMAFWPSDEDPDYVITCVEGGRELIGPDKYNPSVQRINLHTGAVATILRGMNGCDGIRRTPWGTILATEERSDGGAYEILFPQTINNETVNDRATGDVTDPARIAKRPALPTMAWEGLTVLHNGVVIGGDELRPGTDVLNADGGAIFKFVPAALRTDDQPIDDLDDSPLVAGSVYAMTISCRETSHSNFPQYGQGCEIGQGAWVKVNAATARSDADANGATGYYRPEDLHRDPAYEGDGIRFCWTNTGREAAEHYGEVLCAIDHNPEASGELTDNRTGLPYLAYDNDYATITANRFVEGDADFNSFDNLAFQPGTGNLYVIEDHPNGDIFACLQDGADRDIKTDGCIKILSVKDTSAEPTGFMFFNDGKSAILSIQHSDDSNMSEVDDYRTDDVLIVEGFKVKSGK